MFTAIRPEEPRVTFTDLSTAIRWFHPLWVEHRDSAPLRLHYRDEVEPQSLLGTPEITPQFLRHLAAAANDVITVTETRTCGHVRNTGSSEWECPDCAGSGVYEAQRAYYRDPLARAFWRLGRTKAAWPRGFIAPDRLIIELAARGYSVSSLAHDLVMRESVLGQYALRAFRMLADQYRDAPITRPGWVDKSEAQRAAETAGTAA